MVIVIVIVIGLVVGSFLNAVIFRLRSGRSFVFGHSECVHCHHALSPLDLIPVISFIFLRGLCRYCAKKISWQYPIIELLTAIIFVLLFPHWMQIVFACFLIVIGVFDYKHYLILDKVVYPAIGLALVWSIVNSHFVNSLYGAVMIGGFFALQYYFSKGRWIGFGDVKFGIFLGILFGLKLGLGMLIIAYCLGALVGLILVGLKRKHLASKMPFGSFLSVSAIIVMIWGGQIAASYLKLIGIG